MAKIMIEKPSADKLAALGVTRWPTWTKEVSEFPWSYSSQEVAYIVEGEVTVIEKDGEAVSFGAVSYTHLDVYKRQALDNVTLNIAAGERIALLGRPGAGKTTLLRSLAGLSKLDAGQILVDGLSLDDIASFDRAHWLAWKSQDPALFAGTLEDNLTISGSGVNSERFILALWASGLEDELKSGRLSLGMQIDERGSNLSGGQRQKVALARTLAQPCRILLLDEPTLGLDPDSERLLADRLPQLLGAQDILIMTTHSAIMLGLAQRVIAMDAGKVVADGPREKLLRVG